MIRRSNLLILLLGLFSLFSVSCAYSKTSASVLTQTGQVAVEDWEGDKRFDVGWSEWSTTKPTASTVYVRSAVYVQVANWGNEKYNAGSSVSPKYLCTPEESNCFVKKPGRDKYEDKDCTKHVKCERQTHKDSCAGHDSSCSKCDGWNNYDSSDFKGCTGGYNGDGYCKTSNCDKYNSQPCYYMWIYATYDVPATCSEYVGSYYNETNDFKDPANKNNWYKSLSAAGGYAKKVYIYSYPERVFIDFNGSNSTGLCTSWASGSNNVNSNTAIKYEKGNPVCSTNIISGNMDSSYINYYPNQTNGNYTLPTNQYYKIGYDFKGWVYDSNKINSDGTLKSGKTVDFADKAVLSNGAKAELGNPMAGTRVTLYAVWQKHDYKITYNYYCGNGSAITKIYNYGSGLDLATSNNTLIVSDGQKDSTHQACDTESISYYDYANSNTVFEGWFTDSQYVNQITKIPDNWYTDIDLYAKLMQKRTYDYVNNRWKYTALNE